jgi:hypothetical protein
VRFLTRGLITFFISIIASPQTLQKSPATVQEPSAEQQATVQRLAKIEKNFGKKMNTPGVDLSAREISRSGASDRTLVTYELIATGMPKNKTYSLFQLQINGSLIKNLSGVTLDEGGRAICAGREDTCKGDGPNDPIDLVLFAGKAEPKRFALTSDDSAVKGFVEVVPFPNMIVDKGCRLESIIGMPKGEVTYVRGSGFSPNEELTVDSESYGEKIHATAKAEPDGSYFAAALPNVLGKESGTTVWRVKAKDCAPSLTFSWGTYQLEWAPVSSRHRPLALTPD